MAPPLNTTQLELLNDIYYENKLFFGRDRIFKYLQENHPDSKISRRQVSDWLSKQEVNQLHQDGKGKPKDFKSTVTTPHKILSIDLTDLRNFEKNEYKWLLVAVDLGSKYLYAQSLKDKTPNEVLNGLKKILKNIPDLKSIRSDNGKEFTNKKVKDYLESKNIKQVFSEAGKPQSNPVERYNRTLKRLLNKTINLNPSYEWYKEENLKELVDNVNKTNSRITNMTADKIESSYKDDDKEVLKKAYEKELKKKSKNLNKEVFKVNDKVRIYQPNDKEKSNKWSKEIYTIKKVYEPQNSNNVYEYKLNEFNDRFKEEELLKVPSNTENRFSQPDKFVISKIVKPMIISNVPHYVIRWKNYKETTAEPRDILMEDVPKLIRKFDKENGLKWYKLKNGKWKFYYEKD